MAVYADIVSGSAIYESPEGRIVSDIQKTLSETIIGSDTAAGQVIEVAMKEYLHARDNAPARKITEARRRAIQEVVNALNSIASK